MGAKQVYFERRAIAPMKECELRAESDGKLRGYAVVFNQWADDGWGGVERVLPGAFKKTLKESPDIRALWNHDTSKVLGRTTAGTLKLWEDDHGLAIEIDPPDTQAGRDAVVSISRGDVSQMSFGFNVIKETESYDEDMYKRELVEVRLHEVSPVTFPFYPTTEIGVRIANAMQSPELRKQIIEIVERGQQPKPEDSPSEPEETETHSDAEDNTETATEPEPAETHSDADEPQPPNASSEPVADGSDHSTPETDSADETRDEPENVNADESATVDQDHSRESSDAETVTDPSTLDVDEDSTTNPPVKHFDSLSAIRSHRLMGDMERFLRESKTLLKGQ